MPSKSAQAALRDIEFHISLISKFIADVDFSRFESDMRTNYAVTRCLEIISEASRRLPDDLKTRHPEIAWKQIAAAGNIYRHNYEAVAVDQVWETLQVALPLLKVAVDSEIALLP